MRQATIILATTWLAAALACAQAPAEMRTWTDAQGRAVRAEFVSADGGNVTLKLENGTTATVPVPRLSAADQAFIQEKARKVTAGAGAGAAAAQQALQPLVWPESITVPSKDLEITTAEQNAADRRYVYRSGAFQFEANSPLAGTVMREIAHDFELTRALFLQLPWGWQPRPPKGQEFFQASLYETEADYLKAGGAPESSASSRNDRILTKFASLGLKKVGERYAYDSKLDKEGDLISMITRLMMGDMRDFMVPWSANGLEDFMRRAAYRNNAFVLGRPHNAVKQRVEFMRESGYPTDVDRMVKYVRARVNKPRAEQTLADRHNVYLDGMLLVFFFGYLDDEGKGTRLHEYYRAVAADAVAYREYEEGGRRTPLPFSGGRGDRAAELVQVVLQGRSDEQLRDEIINRFKSVGIRL